jgi:hypothetical protein
MDFFVAFIRGMLGNFGSSAMDFYFRYSYFINGLILLYALLVVGARRSYQASWRVLAKTLEPRFHSYIQENKRDQLKRAVLRIELPWQEALQASRFPLITGRRGIWVYPRTLKTLQRLFDPDHMVDELLKPS